MNKFVSIDIETTGLDAETCQILSIGAVIEDFKDPFEKRPTIHIHLPRKVYQGEPFALHMNAEILKHHSDVLADPEKYSLHLGLTTFSIVGNCYLEQESQVAGVFHRWLYDRIPEGKVTVAGKNYANFDDKFLSRLIGWKDLPLHHRILDPAMSYWDPSIDGATPPNLQTCLERAGLPNEITHDAVDDANQVADLIVAYANSGFTSQPVTTDKWVKPTSYAGVTETSKLIEVWVQGFSCNGGRGSAYKVGEVEAENLLDACEKLKETGSFQMCPLKVEGDAIIHWGRHIFDNEKDARDVCG